MLRKFLGLCLRSFVWGSEVKWSLGVKWKRWKICFFVNRIRSCFAFPLEAVGLSEVVYVVVASIKSKTPVNAYSLAVKCSCP
jgi:hypothetical protein